MKEQAIGMPIIMYCLCLNDLPLIAPASVKDCNIFILIVKLVCTWVGGERDFKKTRSKKSLIPSSQKETQDPIC